MITEEMYEIDIPIYIEKNWITYEYNYGMHWWEKRWNAGKNRQTTWTKMLLRS